MQIPLVESRLALSYSSWFSDSEFAFFVRGFGHALFIWLFRGENYKNERFFENDIEQIG